MSVVELCGIDLIITTFLASLNSGNLIRLFLGKGRRWFIVTAHTIFLLLHNHIVVVLNGRMYAWVDFCLLDESRVRGLLGRICVPARRLIVDKRVVCIHVVTPFLPRIGRQTPFTERIRIAAYDTLAWRLVEIALTLYIRLDTLLLLLQLSLLCLLTTRLCIHQKLFLLRRSFSAIHSLVLD